MHVRVYEAKMWMWWFWGNDEVCAHTQDEL